MDTTIIIVLVVLIVIVGIAIVAVLIKSKKKEKTPEEASTMTFQEQTPQESTEAIQEPEPYTPKLQEQVETPVSEPIPNVDPMPENPPSTLPTLDQPIDQPPVQSQQVPTPTTGNGVTQNEDLYNQDVPLPDTTQISQDMEAINQANIVPGSTQSREDTAQSAVPTDEQTANDMETIMDAINTPTPEPTTTPEPTQPVAPTM